MWNIKNESCGLSGNKKEYPQKSGEDILKKIKELHEKNKHEYVRIEGD